ncbi:MAG: glycerol kinase GlpK [Bacilli bacterium]|jgi:glycerol kinase
MDKYILAIDQGTTSTRAFLFNHDGTLCFSAVRQVVCLYPKPGWVEQDALQLWVSVIDVVNELLVVAHKTMDDIAAIGITNQRETTIIWDRKTGRPIYNAIVWQSRQSLLYCQKFEKYKTLIHEKTGLLINPYFSASKIRYILDKVPNAQKRAEAGELMFGTVDTWLIYNMTKGEVHATDPSNASRTMLYNIFKMEWDGELLNLFNIPRALLPEVKPSSYDYGIASFFAKNVHIFGVCGDQQAALFGQACFESGDLKNTYGTGCFALMNTGTKAILSNNGLLTTVAWQIDDQVNYALEGSVFVGGAVVQWLRESMNLITTSDESERVARKVEDTQGVYIVPAFVGLGTPYWDSEARGAVFGITRGTNKSHFVRASLEAIAYQSKDVIDIMKKEANAEITALRVDGGATKNKLLLQFQSDILRCEIRLPQCMETTALGVAYIAGLGSRYWKSMNEIKEYHCLQDTYQPKMDEKTAQKKYDGWKRAVLATMAFKSKD